MYLWSSSSTVAVSTGADHMNGYEFAKNVNEVKQNLDTHSNISLRYSVHIHEALSKCP